MIKIILRASIIFCIFGAQYWTHEHRTWYSRFLSVTLTEAPCVPSRRPLASLNWGDWSGRKSTVLFGWGRLVLVMKIEAERVIQWGCVIFSIKLLQRGNRYCRVILLMNMAGWSALETLKNLLSSTHLENLRVHLWLGWERGVYQCQDQKKLCERLLELLQISESAFMCLHHGWIL